MTTMSWRRPSPARWVLDIALGLTWLGLAGCRDPEPAAAPTIVIISIDTTRADRLGCYGYGAAETPAIDRLAQQGVLFEAAYTPTPLTLPAHGSMLTGLLPCAHGVRDNIEFRLPAAATTLAETLRQRGYRTGAFVSSVALDSWHGLDQGFETYDDNFGAGTERICDATNLAAFRWLRATAGGPRLLLVHYWEPHRPYQPVPELFTGDSVDSRYDAELTHADICVGNLVRYLDAEAATANSLVVLTADHGEGLGQHAEPEHGCFLYDSTLRVPLILRGLNLPAGRRVATPVSLVDVTPTVLAAVGAGLGDGEAGIAGRDLLPAARGQTLPEMPIYGETLRPRLAHGYAQLKAVRVGSLKLIQGPRPELYDVVADPQELTDLAGANPEAVAERFSVLTELVGACGASALGAARDVPSDQTVENLRSLGYVSGGGEAGLPDELDFGGVHPKDRATGLGMFQDAIFAAQAGRVADAEQALVQILEGEPDNVAAAQVLGLIQLQTRRPQQAVVTLEAAYATRPASYEVVNALAIAYGQLRRPQDAVRVLQAGLEHHPDRPRLYAKLGQMLQLSGDLDGALAARLRVVELEPETAEGHLYLGDLRVARGELAAARDDYEKGQQLDPASDELADRLRRIHAMIVASPGRAASAAP